MNRRKERGVALILTMILLVVLSVMAVSLMFLSQTETWSSMNYRLMSQARDGAEAGVNKTANFLMYSYTPPASGGNDPIAAYTLTALPVTYSGSPVILSANSNMASNYPVASVQTSFNTAGQGNLTANNAVVNYATYAKLLSMQQLTVYGSTTPATVQTWEITSDGNISGLRNAQVEVSAIIERQVTPVFTYAAFASSSGCSALTFGGGGSTDSYDSSTVSNGSVTTQASDGNVGTNGNLSESGSTTTINGTLSTPRAGVGTCSNTNVTAWTDNQGKVTGGLVELPQPVVYPPPVIPAPGALNLNLNQSWTCPTGQNAISGCTTNSTGKGKGKGNQGNQATDITIPPGSYGDISLQGSLNLHLTAGTYNINSLNATDANTAIIVDSGPVILNVTGNGFSDNQAPVDVTGNSVANASLNPMNFQILYAGTATVKLAGNSQASGVLYAPNASFSFTGGSNWYGAVIGKTMTDMGGTAVHYDRKLQNTAFTLGNYFLSSFTWKKY